MSTLLNLNMILHRIRVKLYPNPFPQGEGTYIARTNNEKTLTINDVCMAMKTRGGYTGKIDTLLENIRQYYDEVAYQLCDGYAIANGYYNVYPNIGGTFASINESFDHKKNPITFRFGTRKKLRKLAEEIEIEVEGVADNTGFIDTFTDFEEDSINGIFVPGNQFAIRGSRIKIEGNDPNNGVYFVPVDNPAVAIKVSRLAENSPTKLTGLIPEDAWHTQNRIEIRTQFSSTGSKALRTPRTIKSAFTIEAA